MYIAIPFEGRVRTLIRSSFLAAKRTDATHYSLTGESFQMSGVTAEQVLQEARRVADGYVRKNTGPGRLWRRIPGPVCVAAGALGATACWCAAILCQGGLPLA